MDKSFDDKVVIITGASSGIGTSTAIKFSQFGASLVLIGLNIKHVQAVEKLCGLYSPKKPLIIIADITKDNEVENIIEKIIMHYNKIDILINYAGIVENGSIIDTDVYQYDRVFNTNVRSIYHVTNLCVPYLIASKGNIVNVSCAAGLRPFSGILAYCMSKSAIDQFTRCVAVELASKGVRVNCVHSGAFFDHGYKRDTNIALEDGRNNRVQSDEDVAEAITFLASNKASFITGTCVPVDGGRHIMPQI